MTEQHSFNNESLEQIVSRSRKMSHKCLVCFQTIYSNLKTAERLAADYCLANPQLVSTQTITESADAAGCSEATFVRLAKHLGYSGFPDLKKNILATKEEGIGDYFNLLNSDSVSSITTSVFHLCSLYLQDSLQSIDITSIEKSIAMIGKANRLLFVAAGDAHFVATSGAQKFLRLGYESSSSSDLDTQLLLISRMSENDIVFCISHSGRTKNVYEIAKTAQELGIHVISITNFPSSPLARVSNVVLLTASFAYDLMDEIIAKRVPALCILDVIYIYFVLQKANLSSNIISQINRILEKNKL